MLIVLAAAALMLSSGCDLEHPSGKAGCTRAAVDTLKDVGRTVGARLR